MEKHSENTLKKKKEYELIRLQFLTEVEHLLSTQIQFLQGHQENSNPKLNLFVLQALRTIQDWSLVI